MRTGIVSRARQAEGGLLGTWVKLPSLETIELLAHAGFDFVVIDLEHSTLGLETAYRLIFAAQALGMAALVRLADQSGTAIQPLLDGGADGLLVPRVTRLDMAAEVARKMVFAPAGERGLGPTARAGRWGLIPLPDYLAHGRNETLRMLQLEDWAALKQAGDYAAVDGVNGLFVGTGDLFLSSGKPPGHPDVQALVGRMLSATKDKGVLSGIAVGTPDEARRHLAMGFNLVMLSNDATMFGRAAASLVQETRP